MIKGEESGAQAQEQQQTEPQQTEPQTEPQQTEPQNEPQNEPQQQQHTQKRALRPRSGIKPPKLFEEEQFADAAQPQDASKQPTAKRGKGAQRKQPSRTTKRQESAKGDTQKRNAENDDDDDDDDDGDESESDGGVYCLCRKPDDGKMMVSCDACHDWFHIACVGLTKQQASKLQHFFCPSCKGASYQSGVSSAAFVFRAVYECL